MHKCLKCNSLMIRAGLYDPEGTIPLREGTYTETNWWICINQKCEDGRVNSGIAN